MKAFRIELARLRTAVAATLPRGVAPPDDEEVVARFAAGAWTVLPEPGDGVAGLVREGVGDVRALELLVDGASPAVWAQQLGDAEAVRAVPDALARWLPRLEAERILGAFTQGAAHDQHLLTLDLSPETFFRVDR